MRSLRVCQLCAVDFTLKRFLLPLIDRMEDAGWNLTTICSNGQYISELRQKGYRIEIVQISRSLNPISGLRTILHLIRLFHRERFDVLHVHTPVAALLGRIAAKLVGVPLVIYTAHGFYFHDEMSTWKRRLYIALEWVGGKFTDFLFTQSSEDAVSAVRLGISKPECTMIIGNGVSKYRFDPTIHDRASVRESFGIPGQAIVIGMVGRMVMEKGYAEFLAAAQSLGSKHLNVYFLLVGERLPSDHDASIDYELTCARRALRDRLLLAGMREDIPEMLAAMDIFCLPSYREGMPRTIIEAMMMAKPVVATDIRGSREVVVQESTGLLVKTRDPKRLAQALEKLILDASLRARMGEEGRMRAMSLYDEQQVVSKQIDTIRQLVAQKGLCSK